LSTGCGIFSHKISQTKKKHKEVPMEDTTKCADSNCHRPHSDVRKKKEKAPSPDAVRQQSLYNKSDEPIPDNSPFFEGRSNPLSSKGN